MDTAAAVSSQQHMVALERANRVRLARAALKRRVTTGQLDAAEVLLAPPWEAESMPVSELLMSQKQWGRERSRKLLTSMGLPESKPLSSLTKRQRMMAAALLQAKTATSSNGRGRPG